MAHHNRNMMKSSRLSRHRDNEKSWALKVGLLVGLFIGVSLGALCHAYYFYDEEKPFATDNEVLPNSSSDVMSLPLLPVDQISNSVANGWKTINVFYGDTSILADRVNPNMIRRNTISNWGHISVASRVIEEAAKEAYWSSQVLQDKVVYEMLHKKRGGYFIDLGANDARFLSNSYALETYHGWQGLCAEGNPVYWDSLSFRNCVVVGAVVGRKRMEKVTFRVSELLLNDGGLAGGIVGDQYNHKDSNHRNVGTQVKELDRFTVPLHEIFEKFDVPAVIDFFSLDVEGAETSILSVFPLEGYRVKLLAFARPTDEAGALLKKHGYLCLKKLIHWGETLWTHSSFLEELDLSVLGLSLEEAQESPSLCDS